MGEEPVRFQIVEQYRAELLAAGFTPLDDAELERVRRAWAEMHHSNAIEGIAPRPETVALYDMFLELRVPPAISRPVIERYMRERVVGRTAAA
jgi:hypothetical protein